MSVRRALLAAIALLLALCGCSTATRAPAPPEPSASGFSNGSTGAHGPNGSAGPTSSGKASKPNTQDPTAKRQTVAPGGSSQRPGGQTDPDSGLPYIEQSALPAEARQTISAIDRGGPFRYDKDGAVFGNFEGVLPKKPRGYYLEYTVDTPGSSDRGARRIVTGDQDREFFYTDDHYQSFKRIRR